MSSLTIAQKQSLITQGYATYHQLKAYGIKKKYDLGRNDWGFREYLIVDEDNNQWDYIPEDGIYELRDASNPHRITT